MKCFAPGMAAHPAGLRFRANRKRDCNICRANRWPNPQSGRQLVVRRHSVRLKSYSRKRTCISRSARQSAHSPGFCSLCPIPWFLQPRPLPGFSPATSQVLQNITFAWRTLEMRAMCIPLHQKGENMREVRSIAAFISEDRHRVYHLNNPPPLFSRGCNSRLYRCKANLTHSLSITCQPRLQQITAPVFLYVCPNQHIQNHLQIAPKYKRTSARMAG